MVRFILGLDDNLWYRNHDLSGKGWVLIPGYSIIDGAPVGDQRRQEGDSFSCRRQPQT